MLDWFECYKRWMNEKGPPQDHVVITHEPSLCGPMALLTEPVYVRVGESIPDPTWNARLRAARSRLYQALDHYNAIVAEKESHA